MAKTPANGERFLMMSSEILMRTDIGAGPKLLFARLYDYAKNTGHARPGIRHLQTSLGTKSRATLQRWIDVLVGKKLITIVPGAGRRTNTYCVPALGTREPTPSVPELNRSVPKTDCSVPKTDCSVPGTGTDHTKTILDQTLPEYAAIPAATVQLVKPKKKPRKKPDPKPRKPNPIWDVVVKLWYPSGVPPSQATAVGRVVKDFKAIGATPEEIRTRQERHLAMWPELTCTPRSVVKHWDQFAKPVKGPVGIVKAREGKFDGV